MILLSLGNPGDNELNALKALCKILSHIPIIAYISNEVPRQEQAVREASAQITLSKATSRVELLSTLRTLREETSALKASETQPETEICREKSYSTA